MRDVNNNITSVVLLYNTVRTVHLFVTTGRRCNGSMAVSAMFFVLPARARRPFYFLLSFALFNPHPLFLAFALVSLCVCYVCCDASSALADGWDFRKIERGSGWIAKLQSLGWDMWGFRLL
jgi:hypothetical protein